ncbi:MAG: UvrD-helicase domain-containing protein [Chloroflexi bacterium]|nr:UvrD-helicase domain-containing protein [Chloroflexota bacterium]
MPRLILTKVFIKDLNALKTRHSNNYRKANSVLMELQRGERPTAHLRDETRIPKALKFQLDPDFRLLLQRVDGEDALIALSVGNHDHVDSFLDGHKGWVFDPTTGNIRELRLATATEEATQIVASQSLQAERPAEVSPQPPAALPPVFAEFTTEMFNRLEISPEFAGKLTNFRDPNDFNLVSLLIELESVNKGAADLLLTYLTGDVASRQNVLRVARGEAQHKASLGAVELQRVEQSTDELISYSDPDDLRDVLERGTFEQWQLFLHPDQKTLVIRKFAGPARIRGISGSGKTVVGLHRARHIAEKFVGTNCKVLYTTFNKALTQSAASLLDSLCSAEERQHIEVTHLHRWCLDYLEFTGLGHPQYRPDYADAAKREAWNSLSGGLRAALKSLPPEYLWNEIEFIYGRFMHDEIAAYLKTDRTGRGRAITETQREAFLRLYKSYIEKLTAVRCVDFPEFVRLAYRQLLNNHLPEKTYAAVIVDEVQDTSEIGMKLLHRLVANATDGLLMIGDGTQRIYTRGFSLRNLGIEVSGRAVVLTKNYRNTQQILEAAFPLVEDEWANEVNSAQGDLNQCRPEFSNRQGQKPIIVKCGSTAEETEFLCREIKYLLQFEGYQPSRICVMARDRAHRQLAFDSCKAAGLPVCMYKAEADPSTEPDRDGVRISSLHSAKGHEYAAVFVVGCVDGVIPMRSATEPDDIASEKAVLYVGMTRARDILYLSFSESQNGQPLKASPFLRIIQDKCEQMRFFPRPSTIIQ